MFRYMIISRALDGLGGTRPPHRHRADRVARAVRLRSHRPGTAVRGSGSHRYLGAESLHAARSLAHMFWRVRCHSPDPATVEPDLTIPGASSTCRAADTVPLATDADVRSGHGSVWHRTRPDHSRRVLLISCSDGWPAMDYVTLATRPMTVPEDQIYRGRMFTIPSGAFTPSIVRLRRTMGELRAIKASFGL